MYNDRRQFVKLACGFAAASFDIPARSEAYPARAVRMIVPFAPGGPTDALARLLADRLSNRLGASFVVENVPGASGNIGTGRVANAPPDGHMLLVAVNSLVINPALYESVPYDPQRDFAPVVLAVTFSTGLCVHPSVPASSIAELIALVRANPGRYSYTSGGVGTPSHLLGELFRTTYSLDLPHVVFSGSSPAIAAVLGGHVPIAVTALTAAVPHVQSGALRAIAVLGKHRSSALPETPTALEAGYAELDGDGWVGLLAPAATPAAIVTLLNREVAEILRNTEVLQRMTPLGFTPVASSPQGFAKQLQDESRKWGKLIEIANLKQK